MAGKRRKLKEDPATVVRLPPVGETGVLLVQRRDEVTREISSEKALELIRKAKAEGHPVWVILG